MSLLAAGLLFVCGGGTTPKAVAQEFIKACGPQSLIVVAGQTRSDAAGAEGSREFLIENGARMVVVLPWNEPTEMDRQVAENLIRSCSGVWIPGGSQGRLMNRFGEDWCRRVFQTAHRRGVHFFGTSAGAMLMSDDMISGYGDSHDTAEIRKGFGLTPIIIDSHYLERNRQNRLRDALRQTGRTEGLGLSEGQWVILSQSE